jgi:tRNA-specific 2-thiouridylase
MNVNSQGEAERVVVGLSGGVDSAVTAALLQEQGLLVEGVTLQLWTVPTAAAPGKARAESIADRLQIPLAHLDRQERFYEEVVLPFADEYAHGRTPNPCVLCNPYFKFDVLLNFANRVGARWIATGHYARVERSATGTAHLLEARNVRKDQSYFLYRLSQIQLRRLLLPLGEIEEKAEVRTLARELQLPVAETEESQDLCFLLGQDYRELLRDLRPDSLQPGPILNERGEVLGRHRGLPLYTVGQRSGLGLSTGEKHYVIELRSEENTLVVGRAPALERASCLLRALSFIHGKPSTTSFSTEVRIRYRAPRVQAVVTLLDEEHARVDFEHPQRRVAPGQSVVFYKGAEVLGGGIIT